MILQRNCHEFIAYENLAGVRKAAAKQGRPMPAAAASVPIAQALPVVRRALKILADREVTPQTGLLKSTLLQLDSTFSERNYGASSFLDFVEKLAASGFVQLKTSGRSVMVELNPGYVEEARPAAEGEDASAVPAAAVQGDASAPAAQPYSPAGHGEPRRSPHEQHPGGGVQEPAGPPLGDQAEGVRRAGQILGAATGARWPMYLRNVKQILRQTEGGFDERRYGFGGLMDLLKGCQREGFVRVERDRRGGLRVFQGAALQSTAPAPVVSRPNLPQPDVEEYENQPIEAPRAEPIDSGNQADVDHDDVQPVLIDTTAELLGRAKPRQPRVRAARPAPAATPRKAAAKKPAARKPAARGKKSGSDENAGNR
jgi:OST-HTH/LOTUS domain-containing protein